MKVTKSIPEGSLVFITALWPVPDNPKRPETRYRSALLKTLSAIGNAEKILVSPRDLPRTLNLISGMGGMGLGNPRFLDIQPSQIVPPKLLDEIRKSIPRILRKNRFYYPIRIRMEKHKAHLKKHLRQSSVRVYSAMVEIWISKVFLVSQISSQFLENPARPRLFGWVDAGFGETRERFLPLLSGRGNIFSEEKINHMPSKMKFRGKQQTLNASLMVASAGNWKWLACEFEQTALNLFTEDYLHDEETILNDILDRFPDKFCLISLA